MMKLSIWQQFSSNHSSNFQVVGIFKNVQEAQEAAEKLREILLLISQYQMGYDRDTPTLPELIYAEEYGIEWNETLDWIDNPEVVAKQFDHYLWCANVEIQTWMGAHPIDKLIDKLGGQTLVDVESWGRSLVVELTCDAPDRDTVIRIYDSIHPHLELVRAEKDYGIPPWREYADIYTTGYYYADHAYYGYINKLEAQLHFTKMVFAQLGYGLPALIAYLKAQGCQNIEYTISEQDSSKAFEES